MAYNLVMPYRPSFEANALPVAGAKAYLYYSGTTTLAPVYENSGLTTPAANPVVANGSGRYPQRFLDYPAIAYRLYITKPDGSELENFDPYDPTEQGSQGRPGGNIESIGTFAELRDMPIPEGTATVRTAGNSVLGFGAARYDEFDEGSIEANDAFVAEHPLWASKSGDDELSGAIGRYFRLAEPVVDPYVFGALGNPSGDGSRLDDEAHKAAVKYCAMYGATYKIRDGIFSLSEQADIPTGTLSFAVEGEPGHEIHWHGTGERITENAYVGPALFAYAAKFDDPNPIQQVHIKGLLVQNHTAEGADHYVFCASALKDDGTLVSGISAGRCDGFVMENCTVLNMSATMVYGLNTRFDGNICINTMASAVDPSRHVGLGFNHPIINAILGYDDTRPSSCAISNNHVIGYACGILAHSSFDLNDDSRRVIQNVTVHDNFCFGGAFTATVRGRVGIYVASALESTVHDNTCWYFDDLGIDIENPRNSHVHNNKLFNCCLGHFWNSESVIYHHNLVVINDEEWGDNAFAGLAFFKKTGSDSPGRVAVNDNEFRCDLAGETRLGQILCTIRTASVELYRNTILNGVIMFPADAPHASLEIVKNKLKFDKLIISFAFPAGANNESNVCPIFVRATGYNRIEGNEVCSYEIAIADLVPPSYKTTPIRQTTPFGAICIKQNIHAATGAGARDLIVRDNRVIGWPISFEFWDEGSGGQRWTIDFRDNNYDGKIVGTAAANVNARLWIDGNHFVWDNLEATAATGDLNDAGLYTAFPANPAEAALIGVLTGTHSGSSGAATLSVSGASFGDLTGAIVVNTTDYSRAIITSNTGTTITGTLVGGTDNDWDAGDGYAVLNQAAGLQYRGGSRIPVLGASILGVGKPAEYVMAKEIGAGAQAWGSIISRSATYAEASGSVSASTNASGDIAVDHDLGVAPGQVLTTMTGTAFAVAQVIGKTSSSFTVRLFDAGGAAIASTPATFDWLASAA